MHARWLIDIAMLYVRQWPSILSSQSAFAQSPTHAYWSCSRQRFECWQEKLTSYRTSLETAGASRRVELWSHIRPIFEEVFLSDMLTRVLATAARTFERFEIDEDTSPIAHNVFTSHDDLRRRCLRMLILPGLPVEQSVELNRLRHAIEHWSDKFLSILAVSTEKTIGSSDAVTEATRYAFRSDLVGEFIAEKRMKDVDEMSSESAGRDKLRDAIGSCSVNRGIDEDRSWHLEVQLLSASCQKWIAKNCRSVAVHPRENRSIGTAALAMVHPDRIYESNSIVESSSERIEYIIDQADRWMNEILSTSIAPSP